MDVNIRVCTRVFMYSLPELRAGLYCNRHAKAIACSRIALRAPVFGRVHKTGSTGEEEGEYSEASLREGAFALARRERGGVNNGGKERGGKERRSS